MGRTACTEPQCLYKGALYLTTFFREALHREDVYRTEDESLHMTVLPVPNWAQQHEVIYEIEISFSWFRTSYISK